MTRSAISPPQNGIIDAEDVVPKAARGEALEGGFSYQRWPKAALKLG